MARIGVDGLMISPEGKGHARSELQAVLALAARSEHELVVFARHRGAQELLAGSGADVVPVRSGLTIRWELWETLRAARRHRLDAFLTLSERLPLAGGPPMVVWMFESPLHRIRANRAAAGGYQRASDLLTVGLWKRSLRRAAHVAFGSHATADEVRRLVGPLRSWSVVYPGLAPGFSPGQGPAPERYVLHLGSADPRDNTSVAVEAARLAGVRLQVAGGAAADGADVVPLGRVTDEELVELYRGAIAYLDPVLYEGFGYGVLEAMACGAPVVASNVASIPEVAGDAALLCPPRDPAAFAAALRRIMDEPELADELRRKGIDRASAFTWERTGEGLAAAIRQALAAPRARASSA